MKTRINQLYQMLRDEGMIIFVGDEDSGAILPFDHDVRTFELHLMPEKDEIVLIMPKIHCIRHDCPVATKIFEELLDVNGVLDLVRLHRDPASGDLSGQYSMPWPDDSTTPEDVATSIRAVADASAS